jgi:DNA mismatch repair protein MutS
VFDVRSGEMKPASAADGGDDRDDTAGTDDSGDPDDPADRSGEGDAGKQIDPETRSILEEIRDTDVNETPPIELMAMVQDWQRSLTDPTDE